ncbi:MAG: helix-turn-helix transcriptional regulator [Gemmatimonadaceae bacterium]|nr:helix-turn-helix transcriptional regulator [Gemmatimonadaceae bacterium]
MRSLRKQVGVAVRRLREKTGLSQEALADTVGVHRTFIGTVERGETNISLDNLQRIARALKVTPSALLLAAEKEDEATTRSLSE